MAKDKRSNKWAFLIYKESAPKDYLDVFDEIHVPFILSPCTTKTLIVQRGIQKGAQTWCIVLRNFEELYPSFRITSREIKYTSSH